MRNLGEALLLLTAPIRDRGLWLGPLVKKMCFSQYQCLGVFCRRVFLFFVSPTWPVPVASDWYSGGSRCVPPVLQHILSWRLGHEIIFCSYSLPTTDSSRAVVSYWWKAVHQVLVIHLGLSLSRKSVARLTDCLDMNRDVKQHSNKQSLTHMIGLAEYE